MACYTGTIFNATSLQVVSLKIVQCGITLTKNDVTIIVRLHRAICQRLVGLYQSQKTQGFCVADFATLSDERRSRSKIFPLFIWIKEP